MVILAFIIMPSRDQLPMYIARAHIVTSRWDANVDGVLPLFVRFIAFSSVYIKHILLGNKRPWDIRQKIVANTRVDSFDRRDKEIIEDMARHCTTQRSYFRD